ncbi:protein containing PLD-like domain [Bacteroidales bacterium 6E]|nr:protein containing PLD-like domain [Bacteroidales bacterium 6E]
MIKPYFGNIRNILVDNLKKAKYDVYIAVAWITDKIFEDLLLLLLENGVSINIIVVNDEINLRGGIDWKALVNKGANVFWDNHHHKFCVIDREKVITGSFNWTYLASNRSNRENIIIIEGENDLIEQFSQEFIQLKKEATKFVIEPEKVKIVEQVIVKENITNIKKYKAYQKDTTYYCGKCSGRLTSYFQKSVPKQLKDIAKFYCEDCGAYYNSNFDYL